jgi:hypothetical protein
MRVSEEPVCIYLFRQKPVFTSLHLRSPFHVVPPLVRERVEDLGSAGGLPIGPILSGLSQTSYQEADTMLPKYLVFYYLLSSTVILSILQKSDRS